MAYNPSFPFHLPLTSDSFTPSSTSTPHADFQLFDSPHQHKPLTLLQQPTSFGTSANSANRTCRNPIASSILPTPNNHHPLHHPTSTPLPPAPLHDSAALSDARVATYDWHARPMSHAPAYNSSMGGPAAGYSKGVKRARSHQRTPSTSTVNSAGPASPYMQTASFPHIVHPDQSPNSLGFYADQAVIKNFPTPSQTPIDGGVANPAYIPSQAAHMPGAHLAMKSFALEHHGADDFTPDFAPPSRQSMSSYGNSPATPQSSVGDADAKTYSLPQNGEIDPVKALDAYDYLLFDDADFRQSNPTVQLYRSESSQAYQDELFNPNPAFTSAPAVKPSNPYLSPHRNILTERLQTANLARSASPASAASRDRSPFRDGSPLAPVKDWKPTDGRIGLAADLRQQQKDEAARAEYAQHRTPLRREPTKTISPKDAVLDFHEDHPPLFPDSVPAGYERYMGGAPEQWPTNAYFSQPGAAFPDLSTSEQQGKVATTADTGFPGYDISGGLPPSSDQTQSHPFQANYQPAVHAKMNHFNESTPDFPASIPSMETSMSDAGLPASSQDSNGRTSTPQRPDDTRANTGTYTCTYHGCTQRFDSHASLQKHKRDTHRSQQQHQHLRDAASASATTSSGPGSVSPRSPDDVSPSSPGPSSTTAGNSMTSAAILARNSQAGPHKCTRINPSTNKPCNTIFSRPYDLTRHEDTIHNNRKQKVRCPMCREEKTFSRSDALTRHMRVVHPEVESFGKRAKRSD